MAIMLKINGTDYSSQVVRDSLEIEQILTSQADTVSFQYKKYGARSYIPAISDEVTIYLDGTKIFGGNITNIDIKNLSNPSGLIYDMQVTDYTYQLDNLLVSKSYTNKTILEIIQDIVASYAPTFTTTNVSSTFNIAKIVFNQIERINSMSIKFDARHSP
jgi:hypothetical protein